MKNGIDFDLKYKCDQYEAHVKITSEESEMWVSTTQIYKDGRTVVHVPVAINESENLAAILSSVNGIAVTHDVLSSLLKFLSHKTVRLCGATEADEDDLMVNTKLIDAVGQAMDISNFSSAILAIPKELN